jgi:hypothetical protein
VQRYGLVAEMLGMQHKIPADVTNANGKGIFSNGFFIIEDNL